MAIAHLLVITFATLALTEVDFNSIPGCARNSCFPFHASSIGCSKFTTDCFCRDAKAPLTCAYQSCNGEDDWFDLEDWFNKICTSPPAVDFSSMPACSRSCIRTAIIPELCPAFEGTAKITRSCLCHLNTTFTGMTSCLTGDCMLNYTAAVERLEQEYRSTCEYSVGFGGGLSGSLPDDEVIQTPYDDSSGGGLSPLELGSIVFGIVIGLISLISSWILLVRWRKRVRAAGGRWTLDPPPYSAVA